MKKHRIINAVLCLLYIGILYNIISPILRFENRLVSMSLVGVVMLVPMYLLIQSIRIKRLYLKLMAILITVLASLISFLVILIIGMNIGLIREKGYDPSFEWVREIVVEDYTIDTYRINGGAMTSYSVIVRQEKRLGLGLKLVKNIYIKDNVGDVEIEWDNHVVTIGKTKIKLKENVYY